MIATSTGPVEVLEVLAAAVPRHRWPYEVRVAPRGRIHLHLSSPDHPPPTMIGQIERTIEVLRRDDAVSWSRTWTS